MRKRLRNRLKDIGPVNRVWTAFRSRHHDWLIEKEQLEYEQRALAMGLSLAEEPASETYRKLKERLSKRGIAWPPQSQGRPLYVVFCTDSCQVLEQVNIPPEISRIGRCTAYYVDDRIASQEVSLSATREFVDGDLPSFLEAVQREQPVDMLLSYLSGSHVSAAAIQQINDLGIPTFFFHLDDRLHFRSRKSEDQWTGPADVCSAYDLNLTNAPISLVKYRVEGGLALFWPQAANRDLCRPRHLPFRYDVSFVGARYGKRPLFVDYLRKNGINVECFGPGWPNGPLTSGRMMEVYAQSRINLGFGYVGYSNHQCLKGRDFEVPMCGALYLTTHNEDLPRAYRIGEEIVTYRNREDCLAKIRELLGDPDWCERIRVAARGACLRRHTREVRIRALLECKPAIPRYEGRAVELSDRRP